MGSIPDPERSHMPAELLSSAATTVEPVLESPGVTTTEACTPQSPCSRTRKATTVSSPHTAMKRSPTHHSQREPVCSREDPALPKMKLQINAEVRRYEGEVFKDFLFIWK